MFGGSSVSVAQHSRVTDFEQIRLRYSHDADTPYGKSIGFLGTYLPTHLASKEVKPIGLPGTREYSNTYFTLPSTAVPFFVL